MQFSDGKIYVFLQFQEVRENPKKLHTLNQIPMEKPRCDGYKSSILVNESVTKGLLSAPDAVGKQLSNLSLQRMHRKWT